MLRKTIIFFLLVGLTVLSKVATPQSALPQVQHWVTAQGVPVYFIATRQVPIVDLAVVFAAGSARDGDNFGLANVTTQMLLEGAGQWHAAQLAEQFDQVGALVDVSADQDMAVISLRSLAAPRSLQQAVTALQTVLRAPLFTKAALQRKQQQILNELQAEQESLAALAQNKLYAQLYGSHPYGHNVLGTAETVKQISRANVVAFYQRYFVAPNARLLLVGDLTLAQAQTLAAQIATALRPGQAASTLPAPVPTGFNLHSHIPHPAQQQAIYFGQLGMARQDPNYFPLLLGNAIFGGGNLVSLLNTELRVKRGLTYGAYSYFVPLALPGPFIVSLQTSLQTAEQARKLAQQTLQDFIQQGPTERQLQLAKQNLIGNFLLSLDTNQALLQRLLLIAFYQLPLDFLQTYVARVNTVTTQQVKLAWQQQLDPKKMAIVTVGN